MTSDSAETFFTNAISKDLFSLCASTKLGKGVARDVYRSALNPDHVFKFELPSMSFQNILEWETWDVVRHTKYAKWFAPCIHIASCGTVLIQAYAREIMPDELPKDVPAFFTDLKADNWGMLNGHPVCRDYGRSLLMDRGLSNKLRKAEWNI